MGVMLIGDIHGDMSMARLDLENVRSQGIDPSTVDYLIVLGDWGIYHCLNDRLIRL